MSEYRTGHASLAADLCKIQKQGRLEAEKTFTNLKSELKEAQFQYDKGDIAEAYDRLEEIASLANSLMDVFAETLKFDKEGY